MSRKKLSATLQQLLPGESNKRIRQGILAAAQSGSAAARSVKAQIDQENRIRTGKLTAGTVTFNSTTEAVLDLFAWVVDYVNFQPGPTTIAVTAPNADFARLDIFTGDDTGSINYLAGTVDTEGNTIFPTVPVGEVILVEVLRNPNGSNTINPPTPNQKIHNQLEGLQGGDSTNYYHLNTEQFNAVRQIVTPLLNWESQTHIITEFYKSITFGNGYFMAFISNNDGLAIVRSSDAINWTTQIQNWDASIWKDSAYGNATFVAVGLSGIGVRYSTNDGNTWSNSDLPTTHNWTAIGFGNGVFVALSSNAPDRIATSTNGINWTIISTTEIQSWKGVVYGNGTFVACSASGYIMRSTDNGATWLPSINSGLGANDIAFGNDTFVTVGFNGNIAYSLDNGLTWTPATGGDSNSWQSIVYGDGLFVAVADSGAERTMYSKDGINWIREKTPKEDERLESIAYGNGIFVATSISIAGNTTDPIISSSFKRQIKHSNVELDDGRNPHQTRYEDLLGNAPATDRNIDGGTWDSAYLPDQNLNGGTL